MSHHHHHHHHNNRDYVQETYIIEQNGGYQQPQVEIIVQQPNGGYIQQYQQGYNPQIQYQQGYNPQLQYQQNQFQQQGFNQNQQFQQGQYGQNQQFQQGQNQFQQGQQFNQNQQFQQGYNQQGYNQQGSNQQFNQNQQYNQNQQQNDPFYSQTRRALILQEKWFSITNNLSIKDEQGNQAYLAQGKFFHLGLDMYLKDNNNTTLCEIKSKIFTLMPEYDFYQNGQVVGKLRKELHLFTEAWHFEDIKKGQKWQLTGDFLNYDWKIHNGQGQHCAEISRRHSFIKDSYGISIEPGADLTLIICCAVAMEKYHHDAHIRH